MIRGRVRHHCRPLDRKRLRWRMLKTDRKNKNAAAEKETKAAVDGQVERKNQGRV